MKKYTNAFELAKKASDYGIPVAAIDEARYGFLLSKEHDVMNSLDRNLDMFNDHGKMLILLQKGSYYIFHLGRLDLGLDTYLQALKLCTNEHSVPIKYHMPVFGTKLFTHKFAFYVPQFLYNLILRSEETGASLFRNEEELNDILNTKFRNLSVEPETPELKKLVSQVYDHYSVKLLKHNRNM